MTPNKGDGARRIRPDRALPGASRYAAALAVAIGLVVLAGWTFELDWAKRVAPTFVPMKANTAVSLIALGATWFLARRAALAACGLVSAIAFVTLVEYVLDVDLGIDELVFTDSGPHPGRMAVVSAVCLATLALARAALLLGRWHRLPEVLALLVLGVSFLALVGYTYGVSDLYSIGAFSTMAVHTAAGLLVLALAVLATVPQGIVAWIVRGRDAGAVLLRRVLPVELALLPLFGFLQILGRRADWYDLEFGVALNAVAAIALITGSILYTARALARIDARREQALAALNVVNADLENRARARAEQVQDERAARMVLEERQRIAADLHDVVIQRLYAAGLALHALAPSLPDPAPLEAATDRIDDAIVQLRESISHLKRAAANDLVQRLKKILEAAPPALATHLSVHGALSDVPADVLEHLLAVAQEAVSNAVRHAHATELDVRLDVTQSGDVTLNVTDDGVGIDPDVVSTSGLQNIRRRAQQLGGWCTWQRHEPTGTAVIWQVPRTTRTATREAVADEHAAALDHRMLAAWRDVLSRLGSAPPADPLTLIAHAVRDAVDADGVTVMTPLADGSMLIAASEGLDTESLVGTVLPREAGLAAHVLTGKVALRLADPAVHVPSAQAVLGDRPVGPSLLAPLCGPTTSYAVIGLTRAADGPVFTDEEDRTVSRFLRDAGLLLDLLSHGLTGTDPDEAGDLVLR